MHIVGNTITTLLYGFYVEAFEGMYLLQQWTIYIFNMNGKQDMLHCFLFLKLVLYSVLWVILGQRLSTD